MINLIKEEQNLEHIELYPNIIVYKNVLKDVQSLYKIMKDSESNSNGRYFLKTWDQWSVFGTYSQSRNSEDPSGEKGEIYDKEKFFAFSVSEAYNKVISHYIKKYNLILPENARFSGNSFSKYEPNIDHMANNLTMQYHTDFILSEKDMPGDKFLITCTMYINDDYEGGDIEFYIDGDVVCHKPEAGDIVVFPSGEPYYHGVKTIKNGNKFFVRNFVIYSYSGSKEWLENQIKYGAYRWAKMEFDRIENEGPKNMLYIKDGKRISYEEVLKDYENKSS